MSEWRFYNNKPLLSKRYIVRTERVVHIFVHKLHGRADVQNVQNFSRPG